MPPSHPKMAALIHNDGMEPTLPKGSIAVAEYPNLDVDRWTVVGYRSQMTLDQCAFIAERDSNRLGQLGSVAVRGFYEEHFRVFGPLRINRVGRVVGLPNETLRLGADGVYVNGALLEPPEQLKGIYANIPEAAFNTFFANGPIAIPENQVFILQDNLATGNDSRSLGTVKLTSILGKLNDVVLPNEVTLAALFTGTPRLPADVLQDLEEQHGPISSWLRPN